MTAPFVEKLRELELSMSQDIGEFELFIAVLRDESPEKWDLIVSAPWLDAKKRESFKVLADNLQARFTPQEFLDFSRVVILEKGNPFLEALLAMGPIEHSLIEYLNITLLGITIQRAYVITARGRLAQKRRRRRNGSPAK